MPMSSGSPPLQTKHTPGFRFRFPSQTTIIGATQSGKTTLLKKIIENCSTSFDTPITNIFWFCGVKTPGIPTNVPNLRVYEGLPDVELLKEHKDQTNVVVCDDLMTEFARSKDSLNLLNTLFTVYAHHYNCAVFNLVQSAFALPPVTRNNSTYIILMRSLSDAAQIKNLLVQQFGDRWRGAYQAYEDVMSKPYQAMMINNDPHSPPSMRILSNFIEEYPVAYETV
ncbi:hypothetical protein CRE_05294 [Caenorhabditis remanei]|uniref:Uncharacterized protein n=2 Tax=Caenorhabditis remanei TaxID=31234 RepID=E3NNT9_CAERE|nr:hypothetical protein CRE_05294 [Caenorhabditis remanei]